MADRGGFLRGEVITYAYLLLYIAMSSGQIFFNKVILPSVMLPELRSDADANVILSACPLL